jgi:hypothetical protein
MPGRRGHAISKSPPRLYAHPLPGRRRLVSPPLPHHRRLSRRSCSQTPTRAARYFAGVIPPHWPWQAMPWLSGILSSPISCSADAVHRTCRVVPQQQLASQASTPRASQLCMILCCFPYSPVAPGHCFSCLRFAGFDMAQARKILHRLWARCRLLGNARPIRIASFTSPLLVRGSSTRLEPDSV